MWLWSFSVDDVLATCWRLATLDTSAAVSSTVCGCVAEPWMFSEMPLPAVNCPPVITALCPWFAEIARVTSDEPGLGAGDGPVTDGDPLVTHPVTFAGRIGAELANRPWLSTVLSPLSFFSVDDPPALPRLPATIHLRRLGVWWPRLLMRLARQATASWCEPVRALRTRLGLPLVGHPLFEGQFSPLGTLALFSRVLGAPQRDWPPRTLTTGFVFHDGVGAPSPEMDAFLDEGPPPVVFTLGSSAVGAPGRFFEESVAAVAALGVRAILIIGPYPDNRPPGALPRDVLVTDVVSHHRLFPRAAVIVHHGGIGTTGQSLRSGCPMLVVPHAHDQPDNAYRAGRLGVARTVWPRAYRACRVARELSRLLGDGYRIRAADVAREVGAEGGAEAAADTIEDTLASP